MFKFLNQCFARLRFWKSVSDSQNLLDGDTAVLLKYGSEEKGSLLYKCSILLGFIMSKKHKRMRSELLSDDKITNLLGFLTH